MQRCLIYKHNSRYRTLDTKREVVVGVYYSPIQARHGWAVYEAQGMVGCGMDYSKQDEYVTDVQRSLYEVKRENALQSSRQSRDDNNAIRDKQIVSVIDRYSN